MVQRNEVVAVSGGFRVELVVAGRHFLSRVYGEKPQAAACAEQNPWLIERLGTGDNLGGYSSLHDFLNKLVTWFGWEEIMSAEQTAIRLKAKQELVSGKQLLEQLKNFHIYDQRGYDLAADVLKQAKTRWKLIEAERKKVTKPLWDAYQEMQELFAEPLTAYASVEKILKQKVLEAQQRARAAQDAALQAAQQAFQAGDRMAAAMATHVAQQSEVVQAQGIQMRSKWTFEVIDIRLVPEQFTLKVANDSAIQAHIAATEGQAPIPGIRIFEAQTVAVRT